MKSKTNKAFTLIELLVVISIIGILVAISAFALGGARESARDGKRKSDLELIRSGLEIYKADCDEYPDPANLAFGAGNSLTGDGTAGCSVDNTYISEIPQDPTYSARQYSYSSNGITYTLCASLENDPGGIIDIGACGSCGDTACNYTVTSF